MGTGKAALPLALLVGILLSSCGGRNNVALPPLAHPARAHRLSTSQSYQSVVLGDGPVAYYQLNDTGSTAADSTTNGLNGTVGSSVVEGAPGLLTSSSATAMSFPGLMSANGAVRVPVATLLQPSSTVSLEAWFEFTTAPANFTVLAAYGRASGSASYELYFKNGAVFTQATLSSGLLNINSSTLQANTVYHAVTTYDGNNLRLYLNGALVATSSAKADTLSYQANYGFSIGDDDSSTNPGFAGTIAQVAVYPLALSATQVSNHYAAGTASMNGTPTPTPTASPTPIPTPTPTPGSGSYVSVVEGDGPTAFYQLNDTGTIAADSSGNNLSGAIGSGITTGAPGLLTSSSAAAMSFPGTESTAGAVRVAPQSLLQPSAAVSLEAWFKFSTAPANFTVLAAYGRASGSATYELYFKNGEVVTQATLSSGLLNLGSGVLSANTVYHAVTTYNGSVLKLYLNGVLVASSAAKAGTLSYAAGYGFSIGDDYSTSNPAFAGTVQEVAVYSTALSAAQVSNHYAAGTAPSSTPSPFPNQVDWDTFGYDLQRTGYNPNETTVGNGNVGSLKKVWSTSVIGSSWPHEPVLATNVYVNGNPTNVIYIGSNGGSTMYAFNVANGQIIWQDSVPSAPYTCGTTNSQFSIGESPVIDRAKNRVYFADGHNQLHAVDLATGVEASGWPITIADYTPDHNFMHGGMTLNTSSGTLYVVTGSTCDISPWYGRIVAINTSTASIIGTFYPISGTSSQGGSGGGIWGPGGASIDPSTGNVFIVTGNADTKTGQAQNAGMGEEIIELTPTLSSVIANNYPTNIPVVTGFDDFDFGATPLLFTPPGCPEMAAAVNKSGMFELWDVSSINSGPVQFIQMSITTDAADFVGVPAYDPVTNYVYIGLPSTQGIYTPGLGAFSLQSNCTLNPTPVWSAPFGPDAATGAYVPRGPVTIANGVVYVGNYSGDTEFAFDAGSGAQLWSTALPGLGSVGTVIANGVVFIGSSDGTLSAWTPNGTTPLLKKRKSGAP